MYVALQIVLVLFVQVNPTAESYKRYDSQNTQLFYIFRLSLNHTKCIMSL